MKIKYGSGKTEYGPGIDILMDGVEIANAIYAYLVAHGVHVDGPATITINEHLIHGGRIYIDPSGSVLVNGRRFLGRGPRGKTSVYDSTYEWGPR